ncbi:hypothetical protein V5799_015038 [Amblyomma americanum]|uniref:Uncharacterized protein n=1 Tax=Amblyomma americanum TaxID=6943 RepID=A0AAQ4E1A6_AMBAM
MITSRIAAVPTDSTSTHQGHNQGLPVSFLLYHTQAIELREFQIFRYIAWHTGRPALRVKLMNSFVRQWHLGVPRKRRFYYGPPAGSFSLRRDAHAAFPLHSTFSGETCSTAESTNQRDLLPHYHRSCKRYEAWLP